MYKNLDHGELENFLIELIEDALGYKLYEHQKLYILGKSTNLGFDRCSGRTTAICVRLALLPTSEPLDMRNPHLYADMRHFNVIDHMQYSRNFFRRYFMDIRQKLKDKGLKVVDVRT